MIKSFLYLRQRKALSAQRLCVRLSHRMRPECALELECLLDSLQILPDCLSRPRLPLVQPVRKDENMSRYLQTILSQLLGQSYYAPFACLLFYYCEFLFLETAGLQR